MTRESYLQELWARLSNRMPRQELDNVMRYYEEYFDEAGLDREAEVIAELGTPERLAAQIMGERPADAPGPEYGAPVQTAYAPRKKWTGGKIAAAICLSPIWAPLLLALIVVGAALIFTLFAAVLSLTVGIFAAVIGIGAAGIVCIAGGVFSAVCGFSALFTPGVTTTMFFAGFGMLLAGLGVLLLAATVALLRLCGKGTAVMWRGCCKATATSCRWVFRRNQNEVVA